MKKCLIILLVVVLFACEKDDMYVLSDVINKIEVNDDDNKLRNIISLDLMITSEAQVVYWKKGEPDKVLKTKSSQPNLKHAIKLSLLEAESTYCFQVHLNTDKGLVLSDVYTFVTRAIPGFLPSFTRVLDDSVYNFDGYIAVATKTDDSYLYIINDKGKIVWYQSFNNKVIGFLNYNRLHQTFQCIVGKNPYLKFGGNEFISIDLTGDVLFRRTYDQLENGNIHHDFTRLPNGDFIVVNFIEKEFDLSALGLSANEKIISDGLTIYDKDASVKWTWSSFDHMDVSGYVKYLQNMGDFTDRKKNDLIHSNSVSVDLDGNYLMTHNGLNQLWKINATTGEVIYKLGVNGNVEVDNEGLTSGIHSSHINLDGEVMIFDNGKENEQSRIISYLVDENNKEAQIKKLIDLPNEMFSKNQSCAYMINQENIIVGSSVPNLISIVDLLGEVKWQYKAPGLFYRAYYLDLE